MSKSKETMKSSRRSSTNVSHAQMQKQKVAQIQAEEMGVNEKTSKKFFVYSKFLKQSE